MQRHGYFGCGTCHADPSGGGLLTAYGRAQGDLLLRMHYGAASVTAEAPPSDDFDDFDDFDDAAAEPGEPAPTSGQAPPESGVTTPLWGLIDPPSWLLVGGSYRHLTIYQIGESDPLRTFPMMADVFGQVRLGVFRGAGSLGVAKVDAGSPHARRAQLTSNQGDQLNLLSRTHWVGVDLGSGAFLLRAGRIDLPFGVRIPEHVLWVRDATRTDRESDQQHGVAIAYSGELLRGEAMAILGNYQLHPDRLRERGYSAYLELQVADWAAVGASSLVTHAQTDFQALDDGVTRQAHGPFARVSPLQAVVVLVEGDVLLRSERELGYVGFLQVDVEVFQGLHWMATGELLDIGYQDTGDPFDTLRRTAGFGRPRYGGWLSVDWFFLPQLEVRADLVARQEDPLTLLAQLHVYL
jgi:hypothetical protein